MAGYTDAPFRSLCAEILVELPEVGEVVGNGDDAGHSFGPRFADDDQLVNRVLGDEAQVGVSVEIPHNAPFVPFLRVVVRGRRIPRPGTGVKVNDAVHALFPAAAII
jgi:hypothetical protein